MTKKVELQAQLRNESNGKAKNIRTAGFIPAVIYGLGAANQSIKIKNHDFKKTFAAAGEFNLIDLSVDGAAGIKVIVKDVQRDSLTNNIIHVDFYQVDMAKKITTEIPLHFTGESKAVKDLGGTLVKNMDKVEVKCLPGDLVSHIEVDISQLVEFEQFVRLHDLILPPSIELVSETNEAVVGAVATKVEVEAPKAAEAEPVEGQEAEPAEEKTGDETKEIVEK